MQTSKTRNGPSEAPQRTSPATPRSSRVAKTGRNEADCPGITPTRTPTERSPKVTQRRSPRSPTTEKKRPSRLNELDSKVSQLQDELKKTKEQLTASEARRRHAQQEADEAKKQEQDASSKLEDSQSQLAKFSATEESRLQELCKIQQEHDRSWQTEIEALQKQQSADAAALSSAMSEIQRLKLQLEATVQYDAARANQCEYADSELEGLKQEMELWLVNDGESDKAAADANAVATETKLQLGTAKATIDSLVAEGVRLQECLRSKDIELSESKARVVSLEEELKKMQAAGSESVNEAHASNANGGFGSPLTEVLKSINGSPDSETEHLRTVLEVAEMMYQEEQTRMTIETKTAYEMLENVKSECARQLCDVEMKLKSKNDELMAALAGKTQDLHWSDGLSEMQPELEAKLMKSITDIAELKANLMDKENALQSMAEENETLKSEAGRNEADVQQRYEAAVAELELAKAAEQYVQMRLGYVTEESDKSSRCAARASEQLDAAQAASAKADAELRRLRVQSDQWRKAAEAAAAALESSGIGGNNGGQMVERTGSLQPEYNSSIGRKLMGSPFSDEESPKRRNSSGMLRRMSGLWKKSPK